MRSSAGLPLAVGPRPEQGGAESGRPFVRTPSLPKSRSAFSFRYGIGFVLGTVLLVAAATKGHRLLTDVVPGTSLLTSRTVQLATVESELAIGLWLVSGFYRRAAGRVALAYFVLLAAASAFLLVAGAADCGCLGRRALSPWFTFVFDVFAVCCLSLCPFDRTSADQFDARPRLAVALVGVSLFAGVYLLAAASERRVAASEGNGLGEYGALVILDTENWAGKRLPILDAIDVSPRLRRGRHTVVLYHDDCPRCEEVIARATGSAEGQKAEITLVEVPPFDGKRGQARPEWEWRFVMGRLAASRRWVVETPQIITLDDGVVIETRREFGVAGPHRPSKE